MLHAVLAISSVAALKSCCHGRKFVHTLLAHTHLLAHWQELCLLQTDLVVCWSVRADSLQCIVSRLTDTDAHSFAIMHTSTGHSSLRCLMYTVEARYSVMSTMYPDSQSLGTSNHLAHNQLLYSV
jgi:hypothetical protein